MWFQAVISCRIKPNKFLFLVFLVEFQLYFTGFLKVYVTVLLFRKYLTSKIEKNVPHGFLLQFLWTPWSWKESFTTWNVLKPEVYLTCINFWKFHDDLKEWLPSWPENVKFNVKMQFFTFLTPWKIRFWINGKFKIYCFWKWTWKFSHSTKTHIFIFKFSNFQGFIYYINLTPSRICHLFSGGMYQTNIFCL